MDILLFLWNLIYDNLLFIGHGYTSLKTIVFGVLLGVIILGIIKMFQFLKKDPKELLIPIIPFIFLGSSSRALVDNGILPKTLYTVTPGIYIIVGLITISVLLISILIEKKTKFNYRNIILSTGIILSIPIILSLKQFNFMAFFLVLISLAFVVGLIYLLKDKFSILNDKFNFSVIFAHMFDAASTFIAVDFFGYWEQHVLPAAIANFAGTASIMFPLKLIVILPSLYLIDNYIDDDITKNTLKLSIFILGLAPGLRNFLSLCMGTL